MNKVLSWREYAKYKKNCIKSKSEKHLGFRSFSIKYEIVESKYVSKMHRNTYYAENNVTQQAVLKRVKKDYPNAINIQFT